MNYVAGFLFDSNKAEVLLIKKKRPKWQEGRYNGIGGKIEGNETAAQAMQREFKEEAGVEVQDWVPFCHYDYDGGTVEFYFYIDTADEFYDKVHSVTDEQIKWVKLEDIWHLNSIFNLKWLIPLAIDPSLGEEVIKVSE